MFGYMMVTVSASRSIPGLWGRGRVRIANYRSCATRAKHGDTVVVVLPHALAGCSISLKWFFWSLCTGLERAFGGPKR